MNKIGIIIVLLMALMGCSNNPVTVVIPPQHDQLLIGIWICHDTEFYYYDSILFSYYDGKNIKNKYDTIKIDTTINIITFAFAIDTVHISSCCIGYFCSAEIPSDVNEAWSTTESTSTVIDVDGHRYGGKSVIELSGTGYEYEIQANTLIIYHMGSKDLHFVRK